jgi:hypothetical protein
MASLRNWEGLLVSGAACLRILSERLGWGETLVGGHGRPAAARLSLLGTQHRTARQAEARLRRCGQAAAPDGLDVPEPQAAEIAPSLARLGQPHCLFLRLRVIRLSDQFLAV